MCVYICTVECGRIITGAPSVCRTLAQDDYLALSRLQATIRTQNEAVYVHMSNGHFATALEELCDSRSFLPMRYNNDLLTWLLTMADKVPIHGSAYQRSVKFISIDSLDACRSPSATSDIDVLSCISASMKIHTKGPIIPTAVACTGEVLAAAVHSRSCSHLSADFGSIGCCWGRADQGDALVSIYCTPTRRVLYTIHTSDLTPCKDVWVTGSRIAEGTKHFQGLTAPVVTVLEFSRNSRYLLIATSCSNSALSTVSIWCCRYRKMVGRMSHVDGTVIHARWSHSDVLVTLFFSEESFSTYLLDWPELHVVGRGGGGVRQWADLCMSTVPTDLGQYTARDTVRDGEGGESLLSIERGLWRSGGRSSVDEVTPSSHFFRSLGASLAVLNTSPLPQSPPLNESHPGTDLTSRILNIIKDRVRESAHAWFTYDARHATAVSTASLHGAKVCLLHGEPSSGKSYIWQCLCSEYEQRVLARVKITRQGMLYAAPNVIAFEVLCSLAQQLYDRFGSRYAVPVIRELSDELRMLCDVPTSTNPMNPPGETHLQVRHTLAQGKGRHARNFSVASSIGTVESASGSESDEDMVCVDRLVACTCRALRLTIEEAAALANPIAVVPDPRYLSVSRLFSILVGGPLNELFGPMGSPMRAVICVDGMDILDSSSTYTHLQSVMDMLVNATPDWCRVFMTSRLPPAQLAIVNATSSFGLRTSRSEEQAQDMFALCGELLQSMSYEGDVLEAARHMYSHCEGSLRNIRLLMASLPSAYSVSEGALLCAMREVDVKECFMTESFAYADSEVIITSVIACRNGGIIIPYYRAPFHNHVVSYQITPTFIQRLTIRGVLSHPT